MREQTTLSEKSTRPLRAVAATALYPLQWLVMQPVYLAQNASAYVGTVKSAQQTESQARQKLAMQALRSNQVEHLSLENNRLRKLLALREQSFVEGAIALGAPPLERARRHLLPHLWPTILVNATLGMGSALLIESARPTSGPSVAWCPSLKTR